jgi:WD40 repeat protein
MNAGEITKSRSLRHLKYVPNSTKISYVANRKIHTFDTATNTEEYITQAMSDDYDWDKQGTKLVYGDDHTIYMLDINTKEQTLLFKGRAPVFSNNNEYIAYQAPNGDLLVHELKTKKEWKCGEIGGQVYRFIFSPDDKYLLYGIQNHNLAFFSFEMFVVDFKSGDKSKLLKGHNTLPAFEWK